MALIYYAHDLQVMKRTQSQIDFMANIMVQIIQNISQNRPSKKITRKDLNYARAAAALSYYGGKTHYSLPGTTGANGRRPLGSFLHFFLYFVQGTGHNKCVIKWAVDGGYFHDTPDNIGIGIFRSDTANSAVRYKGSDSESSSVYQNLKIENGETKIILDMFFWLAPDLKMEDGSLVGNPIFKRFGLLMYPIKQFGGISPTYFHSIVIFTPKPGLFDETPPS